jgi:UDP-N-acetylmuramoyl-L-alanyl-D-glutamate--2,6-diaminopimelate ligase
VTALQRFESPQAAAAWLRPRVAGTLCADSRRLQRGDAFVAWPGRASDGRRFVAPALAAGAAACIVEADGAEAFGFDDARIAALPGLRAAAGALADAFFNAPSAGLDVVATTGTNGKTSTAWWVAQALTVLGRRCGLVGTLGVGEPPPAFGEGDDRAVVGAAQADGVPPGLPLQPTGLTTPDPVTLHAALRRFVDAGLHACALEASSIGIEQQRLNAVAIDVALFTNFTQDHLDVHGSMEAYWAAKRRLFDWPGLRAAVLHVDDPAIEGLHAELAGGGLDLWSYAVARPARLRAQGVHYDRGGLAFQVVEQADARRGAPAGVARVRSRLIGDYNVGNLLGVLGVLRALGVPLADAAAALARLGPVPGRMQRVGAPGDAAVPAAVVDYAHTPDALAQVLQSLRALAVARGGRLWVVFGCGGNRDAAKRPRMAAAAEALADHLVLTSDNPRDEAPQAILAQMVAGLQRPDAARVIEQRRIAIGHALAAAEPQDVVLVAGKGHETTQEIAGVKHPFSDVDEVTVALQRRVAGAMTEPELRR